MAKPDIPSATITSSERMMPKFFIKSSVLQTLCLQKRVLLMGMHLLMYPFILFHPQEQRLDPIWLPENKAMPAFWINMHFNFYIMMS